MFFIPEYILILVITIVIDYYAGIWIEKREGKKKKIYLIISVISTCLVLFFFKYYDFFNHSIADVFAYFGLNYEVKDLGLILPIGLSFHTFQSLSYVIEVYRGKQKAEKNFGIYSLYVMFYPQLVTGPIERPGSLLPQFREEKFFKYENIAKGLRLILFGLFLKMVVADNLSVYVNAIYDSPSEFNSGNIVMGMFFYCIQIYCDFFGYSTIAVGCALSIGFKLMDNFKYPFFAKNISEFWQKWHISLTTWFRDYIYFPLGGSLKGKVFWIRNIFIIFILSGIWHGTNWNYVLFGIAHAFFYICEKYWSDYFPIKIKNQFIDVLRTLKTFLLVTLFFSIFRAQNLDQLISLYEGLLNNFQLHNYLEFDKLFILFIAIFILFEFLLKKSRFDIWCENINVYFRWGIYSVLLFLILVFSSVENFQFVYFQF
jgi:alginate O-acetyltransferase complex protein AlgI